MAWKGKKQVQRENEKKYKKGDIFFIVAVV